ncbi:MAG: scyllo-inositol 2-dehydrogenase [Frankiales bacterium]|jgi:predicted dehydrogenase|nr:scyllo-inositol 2-dehydrogenase [Frankiales bacterium]
MTTTIRGSVFAEPANPYDTELRDALEGVARHLAGCGWSVAVSEPRAQVPAGVTMVMVWSERRCADAVAAGLVAFAEAGGTVLLLGPTVEAWWEHDDLLELAGVMPGAATPLHEIRLRPGPDAGEVTRRFDGDIVLTDRWQLLDKVADDVEVVLTAAMGLQVQPVATLRRGCGVVGTLTVGRRSPTLADTGFLRLVHRLGRAALGLRDAAPVRVGLLGYGAIGREHATAVQATEGLELAAVCDADPTRLDAAQALAPGLPGFAAAAELLACSDVDLVVVSTPPDSHVEWSLRALDTGKSVVVEKPFCLTVSEADEMIGLAAQRSLTLAVYQNRRWDPDYLALGQAIRSGVVGEVFHYESFVGGFGHPCNYWHSDEAVSGGAIYDWGSHYLDWLLDLFPQPVSHVTAASHKRRWHDVTNADHSRVTVRFTDGVEGEFVHSDLAAVLKPKWYVLGTEGAIVGDWRRASVLSRTSIGTLAEDQLAPADAPADLRVVSADGSETRLALPPRPAHPFHRELADQLLSGAPLSVTPQGSRRNVAVMQAAMMSAREDARPQPLPEA